MKCISKMEYEYMYFSGDYSELYKFIGDKTLISFHEHQAILKCWDGLTNLYIGDYILKGDDNLIDLYSEEEFNENFKTINE